MKLHPHALIPEAISDRVLAKLKLKDFTFNQICLSKHILCKFCIQIYNYKIIY